MRFRALSIVTPYQSRTHLAFKIRLGIHTKSRTRETRSRAARTGDSSPEARSPRTPRRLSTAACAHSRTGETFFSSSVGNGKNPPKKHAGALLALEFGRESCDTLAEQVRDLPPLVPGGESRVSPRVELGFVSSRVSDVAPMSRSSGRGRAAFHTRLSLDTHTRGREPRDQSLHLTLAHPNSRDSSIAPVDSRDSRDSRERAASSRRRARATTSASLSEACVRNHSIDFHLCIYSYLGRFQPDLNDR